VSNQLRYVLKNKLTDEGLSLRKVEAACGVSFSSLSRFLRGGDLSENLLQRVDDYVSGKDAKLRKKVGIKRINVGGKTFIITIEEAIK